MRQSRAPNSRDIPCPSHTHPALRTQGTENRLVMKPRQRGPFSDTSVTSQIKEPCNLQESPLPLSWGQEPMQWRQPTLILIRLEHAGKWSLYTLS